MRPRNVVALGCLIQHIMLDPAPAVTDHIPIRCRNGPCRFRITLQRKGRGEHRQGQATCLKQTEEPPKPHSSAIFIHAFCREIALTYRNARLGNLGQGCVGTLVAVGKAIL